MADVIGLNGQKLIDSNKTPKKELDTGTFLFTLQTADADNRPMTFTAEGFLVVTSVFAAVGRGEGEIVAMVPLSELISVQKIEVTVR